MRNIVVAYKEDLIHIVWLDIEDKLRGTWNMYIHDPKLPITFGVSLQKSYLLSVRTFSMFVTTF